MSVLFPPNTPKRPQRTLRVAVSTGSTLRLLGVSATLVGVLAAGACGSQKALTPPATPPPVAAPTSAATPPPSVPTETPTETPTSTKATEPPSQTSAPSPTERATSSSSSTSKSSTTTTKKPTPKPTTSTTTKATAKATPKPPVVSAAPAAGTAPATKAPVAAPVTGCGNPNPSKVFLTFDDGGPLASTILGVLNRYGIKARWFPTGQWASSHTAFMQQLVAGGQMTGNHTYSHPQMLSSLGTAELTRQVNLGYHPTNVFRFPYGASDATSRALVSKMGYSICGWSIDTNDWKGNSADTIYNIVTSQARPGAVVLMHQSFQTDVDALPRIIENLRGRGLI